MAEYKITLSSDKVTLDGKPLDQEREAHGSRVLLQATQGGVQRTSEEVSRIVSAAKENVQSARENEKVFLQTVLLKEMEELKFGKYRKVQDFAAQVEEAVVDIVADDEDLEWIRSGFDKITGKDRPAYWKFLVKLMAQISAPTEIKAKEKAPVKEK